MFYFNYYNESCDEEFFEDYIGFGLGDIYDVIDLYDETDPLRVRLDYALSNLDPDNFYVAAHGNNDSLTTLLYRKGKYIDIKETYSPKNIAEMLIQDGYNKQLVVLLACNTAEGGNNSFAQKLANIIDGPVCAPITTLFILRDGTMYVSDVPITKKNNNFYLLDEEYQDSLWDTRYPEK